MTKFRREGTTATYIVLGIVGFLVILTLISFYLFGSWKTKSQPDRHQSSELYFIVSETGSSA